MSLKEALTSDVPGWSLRTKVESLFAVLVVGGVALWGLTREPAAVPEVTSPAPAVRQADGSLEAERAPPTRPPAPRAILPKGAVRERAARIVATPAAGASSVEVDTELVRLGSQRRLIVSSPDGTIDTAVDIPIEPALIPPSPRPWAAGLSYGTDHAVGVWLERDVGRLRLGAELSKGAGRPRAEIRVGMAF